MGPVVITLMGVFEVKYAKKNLARETRRRREGADEDATSDGRAAMTTSTRASAGRGVDARPGRQTRRASRTTAACSARPTAAVR